MAFRTVTLSRTIWPGRQKDAGAEWHEDPWTLVDQAIENPSLLSNGLAKSLGRTERDIYRSLKGERRSLLRLLSRFDISESQATRFYQETERLKAGIKLADADILANPYCLYETDRAQVDPIPLGAIDRGMFPDEIVITRYPIESSCVPDGPLDPRRVRALLVRELEGAATDGHTLQPRDQLIQAVRDLELRPSCPLSLDAMAVVETSFPPEIMPAEMADGSIAYQLSRLQKMRSVIRTDALKRMKGRRHEGNLNWHAFVDAALKLPVKSEAEELARQEKAAALEQLYCSRLSVLGRRGRYRKDDTPPRAVRTGRCQARRHSAAAPRRARPVCEWKHRSASRARKRSRSFSVPRKRYKFKTATYCPLNRSEG